MKICAKCKIQFITEELKIQTKLEFVASSKLKSHKIDDNFVHGSPSTFDLNFSRIKLLSAFAAG